jgi:hypothetical protein
VKEIFVKIEVIAEFELEEEDLQIPLTVSELDVV